MPDKQTTERLKKVVGSKKPESVWAELYRLNRLATTLGLQVDDGYPPKKIVGKRRAR
jgi:hypothetical protein